MLTNWDAFAKMSCACNIVIDSMISKMACHRCILLSKEATETARRANADTNTIASVLWPRLVALFMSIAHT
eukprot:scaffold33049_cov34-Prasinocladus_malaysianus.AAC.1